MFDAAASSARRGSSRTSIPFRSAARPIARYIEPVSICGMPSSRATRLLVVVLPTPDGPSIATMRATQRLRAALVRDLVARRPAVFEPAPFFTLPVFLRDVGRAARRGFAAIG